VAHHDWLRRQRFDQPALAAAYDSALETVLLTADRGTGWTRRLSSWPVIPRGRRSSADWRA